MLPVLAYITKRENVGILIENAEVTIAFRKYIAQSLQSFSVFFRVVCYNVYSDSSVILRAHFFAFSGADSLRYKCNLDTQMDS